MEAGSAEPIEAAPRRDPHRRSFSSGSGLATLAVLGRQAAGARACVVFWRAAGSEGLSAVPAALRADLAGKPLFALFDRWGEAAGRSAPAVFTLSATETRLLGVCPEGALALAGVGMTAMSEASAHAGVLLVVGAGLERAGVDALLRLLVEAALFWLAAEEHLASREFWRRRAGRLGERLARERARVGEAFDLEDELERALAAAKRLRADGRLGGLATLAARLGLFPAWLVARQAEEGAKLTVVATSAGIAAPAAIPKGARSALADALGAGVGVVCERTAAGGQRYYEDRIFAGYAGYVCLPFEGGVLALASTGALEGAACARVETFLKRLAPLLKGWRLEEENGRLHALVRQLGLRMLGAVQEERKRIARDLHDDHAQILAAVRLALNAGAERAAPVLAELEATMRRRLRGLRPATLGSQDLKTALKAELGRLAQTGVRARLAWDAGRRRLSRAVEQGCYQVVREALANVARHSGASRVEVRIERQSGLLRLTVSDNGRGIGRARRTDTGGLSVMAQRVELLGGSLRIASRRGATRLVAELPEPL